MDVDKFTRACRPGDYFPELVSWYAKSEYPKFEKRMAQTLCPLQYDENCFVNDPKGIEGFPYPLGYLNAGGQVTRIVEEFT